MTRNKVDNPSALQIQNELRLYANEVGGDITVTKQMDITETKYTTDEASVRLFERENEDMAYIKIAVLNSNGVTDVGNYDLEDIKEIEFSSNPQRIYIMLEGGEHCDWGINMDN